ncbi:MAG: acyltransferase family protein [Ilumatobacteraceae bacterium]
MSAGHIPGTHKRTDIEGLRAVAVALVVLYHLKISMFSGGYVGVDVFFVVSGFLITQILIDEIDTSGKIHLRDFWARRLRRIMPMASLVVVLTVIASYLWLEKGRGNGLIPVALGSLGFCANIVLWATTGDYLSGVALPSPLRHYWSLGVEEQFYLVWPILLVVIARLARTRWRFWTVLTCAALFVWSLSESIRITPGDAGAGYYLPQARAWEILGGALLAILATRVQRLPKRLSAIVGWAGLGTLLYAAITFDDQTIFPGSMALVPVLGTVGVLVAAEVEGGPVRILKLAPLQKIGLWSFSLYLWHWPVLVIAEAQYGELSNSGKLFAVAICLLLAAASHVVIEHPIQWNKFLTERPQRTFVAGFSVLALLLGVGTLMMALRPPVDNTPAFAEPAGSGDVQDSVAAADGTKALPSDVGTGAGSTTVVPVATPPPLTPVNAFLVGDSVLAPLRWFEQGALSLQGFTYTLDAESCRRLARQSCEGREDRIPESATAVLQNFVAPVDVIVLVGGYHASVDSIRDELQQFVEVAKTKQAKLVIFTFMESLAFPAPGSDGTRSVYSDFNEILRTMAAEGALGDATIADWNLFASGQPAWFRSDGMHTNITGTLAFGWFISATLAALFNNPCPVDGVYPCVVPDVADPAVDWLTMYNVAYTDTHCYEDGPNRERVCTGDRQM